MIDLDYGSIEQAITALSEWLGPVEKHNTGRQIGMGAITKARWSGPGWEIWTDHFRTPTHGTTIRAFLEFKDVRNETIFRLKYPGVCG